MSRFMAIEGSAAGDFERSHELLAAASAGDEGALVELHQMRARWRRPALVASQTPTSAPRPAPPAAAPAARAPVPTKLAAPPRRASPPPSTPSPPRFLAASSPPRMTEASRRALEQLKAEHMKRAFEQLKAEHMAKHNEAIASKALIDAKMGIRASGSNPIRREGRSVTFGTMTDAEARALLGSKTRTGAGQ